MRSCDFSDTSPLQFIEFGLHASQVGNDRFTEQAQCSPL
jgi:hypothetical protein